MRQDRQREDRVDTQDNQQPDPGEPASGNPIGRAAELLRAGDAAIEQVLSGDSVNFLAASRQLGGQ